MLGCHPDVSSDGHAWELEHGILQHLACRTPWSWPEGVGYPAVPGRLYLSGSLWGRTGYAATGGNARARGTHGGDGTNADLDSGAHGCFNSRLGSNLTSNAGAYKDTGIY